MDDNIFLYVLTGLSIIVLLIGLYILYVASCDQLGWVPVSGLPYRCIKEFTPNIMNIN